MAGKRRNSPSPGPSSRRKLSPSDDPMAVDVELTTVDSSMAASTGSHFPDDVLTALANHLGFISIIWDDDGSDYAFTSDDILTAIYSTVDASMRLLPSPPTSLVEFSQFKKNARKKSAFGFADLLRKALQAKDLRSWDPVVAHGASP
jgi:hypothetical protein